MVSTSCWRLALDISCSMYKRKRLKSDFSIRWIPWLNAWLVDIDVFSRMNTCSLYLLGKKENYNGSTSCSESSLPKNDDEEVVFRWFTYSKNQFCSSMGKKLCRPTKNSIGDEQSTEKRSFYHREDCVEIRRRVVRFVWRTPSCWIDSIAIPWVIGRIQRVRWFSIRVATETENDDHVSRVHRHSITLRR